MATRGRLLDRARVPSLEELAVAAGPGRPRWERLAAWVGATYGVVGEPLWSGRESGWVLRFRRSGRALLTLMPLESGGVRALVVIGPSAWAAVDGVELSERIRAEWASAHPYPDGRWLFPLVDDDAVEEDLERLIALKSPPPRRRRAVAHTGPSERPVA
jgi:hypothetical protein